MYEEIEKENKILWELLVEEIKKEGLDQIIEIIGKHLCLSATRKKTLRDLMIQIETLNVFFKNDFLKCLIKNLFESTGRIKNYRVLDFLDKHELSHSLAWSYDPPKNGQNILKHGLEFGAVASYGGNDFGQLMVFMAPKEIINKKGQPDIEQRGVLFSKFYAKDANKDFFLDSYKFDDIFCVASIFVNEDDKIQFISSRVIKANSLQKLTRELKNLIKDKDLDEMNEAIIPELRAKSLEILKDFYDFKING